ncbi:MAG TPA: hypothetical protein VJ161_07700, partial [Geobacteraceae bacterium]|nr:hypothetical protein [Geobacteraceae bacterium]
IKISIRNPFTGNDSPSFALRGASLISLKADGNGWVIETLPDRKVHEASLTVLGNGQRIEIPLTVAPPIDSGKGPTGGPDNAAFARFLKNRGTDKAPRFDLNGDGVRNYLDDYIFTANHIAKRGSKSGKQ